MRENYISRSVARRCIVGLRTMRRQLLFAALGVTAAIVLGACAGSSVAGADTLVIGHAAALTGGLAPYDQPALAGIQVAVDEINARGGVAGKYKIELRVKDMKSDPATAVTAAQELLDSGAQVLITVCDADGSIASGKVAQQRGVAAISTCSTTPTVPTAVGNSMFLASVGDNAQAAVLAEYASKQGYKNAYLLGSPDTGYTKQMPGYFRVAFEKLGGSIAGEDNFSVGSQDFGPQVTRIKGLNPQPDVIMTPAYVPDSSTFMKQLRAAGVMIPVISTDGNDTPLFIEAGVDAVEGSVVSTHGYPTPGSALEAFYKLFNEKTGKVADTVFIATGYDTIKVIEAAVTKAASTDGKKIRDAMENLQNVQGATATISYSPGQHVPVKPVTLIKVEGGKFVFLGQVTPKDVPAP